MEKDNENTLQKQRSSRACIRDGYQLYTTNFRRIFRLTWPIAIVFAMLSATASALPVLVAPTLLLPGLLLAALAVVSLLTVSNRRLYKRGFWVSVGKVPFRAWMRHLGMVILVVIVCLFIVAVLSLFTSLPTIIMIAANWESQVGMIGGDPSGMPDYVRWLSFVAFLIAGFLQAYVWLSVLCPLYLTHVSISINEKERQKYNHDL